MSFHIRSLKKFFIIFFSSIVVSAVICIVYRKIRLSETLYEISHYSKVELGADLDQFFLQNESKVPHLKDHQAKGIVWNLESKKKSEFSFVFIHGFSASRFEMAPLTANLARDFNANAFFARLTGHGIDDLDAMADVRVSDWMRDVDEAVRAGAQIGQKVVVIASSTSVPPLIHWAMQNPGKLYAAVFLSPNFAPKNKQSKILLYPFGLNIGHVIVGGQYREWDTSTEMDKILNTTKYRLEGLIPMMRLVDTMDAADLSKFTSPVLVLYCPLDDVVDVNEIKKKFVLLGSPIKELTVVPGARQHVLAGDLRSPETTDWVKQHIAQFVRNIQSN